MFGFNKKEKQESFTTEDMYKLKGKIMYETNKQFALVYDEKVEDLRATIEEQESWNVKLNGIIDHQDKEILDLKSLTIELLTKNENEKAPVLEQEDELEAEF